MMQEKKVNRVVIQHLLGNTALSTSDATKEALIKVLKPKQHKLQIDKLVKGRNSSLCLESGAYIPCPYWV